MLDELPRWFNQVIHIAGKQKIDFTATLNFNFVSLLLYLYACSLSFEWNRFNEQQVDWGRQSKMVTVANNDGEKLASWW